MNNTSIWQHHVIGPVSTNCYVFGRPDEATLVDPGGPEAIEIAKNLLENEINIKHVLVTHGHFDHLGWAADVLKVVEGAQVYLHEAEKPAYEPFLNRLPQFFNLPPLEVREPDVWLRTNQILDLSGYKFKVIHTPGHSPGSATFQLVSMPEHISDHLQLDASFVGDLIFESSIGRFDLPFSDPQDMKNSLKIIMDELPSHSQLYPGHGNLTSMASELANNPYLKAIKNNISLF